MADDVFGLIRLHETGGSRRANILRGADARTELDAFLNNSPFKGERLRTKEDNPIPEVPVDAGLSWWNVSSVKIWKTGQVWLYIYAEALKILVSLDHEDKVVVYLQWIET